MSFRRVVKYKNYIIICPNTKKLHLLYTTTCFDLSVILEFTVGFPQYVLKSNCEPEDDQRYVETCSCI